MSGLDPMKQSSRRRRRPTPVSHAACATLRACGTLHSSRLSRLIPANPASKLFRCPTKRHRGDRRRGGRQRRRGRKAPSPSLGIGWRGLTSPCRPFHPYRPYRPFHPCRPSPCRPCRRACRRRLGASGAPSGGSPRCRPRSKSAGRRWRPRPEERCGRPSPDPGCRPRSCRSNGPPGRRTPGSRRAFRAACRPRASRLRRHSARYGAWACRSRDARWRCRGPGRNWRP